MGGKREQELRRESKTENRMEGGKKERKEMKLGEMKGSGEMEETREGGGGRWRREGSRKEGRKESLDEVTLKLRPQMMRNQSCNS